MPSVTHGGLAGKARKVHSRARASRSYAQQSIDDYLEPDPDTLRRQREIPIRGRSEFLPSLAYHSAAEPDQSRGQLAGSSATGAGRELPEGGSSAGVIRPDRTPMEAPIRVASSASPDGQCIRNGSDGSKTDGRRPSTVPFPQPVLRRLETSKRTGRFTAAGFLLGCAMGGAAAAMILLVIRVTLG